MIVNSDSQELLTFAGSMCPSTDDGYKVHVDIAKISHIIMTYCKFFPNLYCLLGGLAMNLLLYLWWVKQGIQL